MHLAPNNSKFKEASHFVQALGLFSAEQLSGSIYELMQINE